MNGSDVWGSSAPYQVLQGALSRQYTGASTVSEMS